MSERLHETGDVLIRCGELVLLQALLDFPDYTAPSIRAWVRAAGALGVGYGLMSNEWGARRAMAGLNATWVRRQRLGRSVVVKLSSRGKAIVNKQVPVRVIGRGPYVSLATLGSRRLPG